MSRSTAEGLKQLRERFQVPFVISRPQQPRPETPQRYVRERVQVVERDPPFPQQVVPEFPFGGLLGNGKERPDRVGDEVEFQSGPLHSISRRVQLLQHGDRGFRHSRATLGIGLGRIRRGEGGDQDDAVGDAEREKRLPCGAAHGGKVRPKHQAWRKRGKPVDEKRKVGHQFRRSAGDIDDLEREPPGERDDRRHRLPGHDLFSVRDRPRGGNAGSGDCTDIRCSPGECVRGPGRRESP